MKRSGLSSKRRVLTSNALSPVGRIDEATTRKMRAVRQAGTSPEIAVRAALESLGIAFETNVEDKPGRPDLWLTQEGIPVFVHGCFWHRHKGCKKATTPKRNRDFWLAKVDKNVERDGRNLRQLKEAGHSPIVVWQCETTEEANLRLLLEDRIAVTRRLT